VCEKGVAVDVQNDLWDASLLNAQPDLHVGAIEAASGHAEEAIRVAHKNNGQVVSAWLPGAALARLRQAVVESGANESSDHGRLSKVPRSGQVAVYPEWCPPRTRG
jgi:hypothetical protein